jgi:hypothetical protein
MRALIYNCSRDHVRAVKPVSHGHVLGYIRAPRYCTLCVIGSHPGLRTIVGNIRRVYAAPNVGAYM